MNQDTIESTKNVTQKRATQTVRTRTRPRMDQLGNIWKMSLMKSESGEWKGAPGMKLAKEAVNTKRTAAAMKMLSRVSPMAGYASETDILNRQCEYKLLRG